MPRDNKSSKKKPAKKSKPKKKSVPMEKKPGEGKLFPEAKLPKGIAALARKMKGAEIARKHHADIESEAREVLCAKMVQAGCTRFRIEVDGQDYEFKLDETTKVTSKQLKQGDE